MDLAVEVYRKTESFPVPERYGLTRQMRRAAVSIPSNVAEGFNRHSRSAYRNHVAIGMGSGGELETQIEVAHRLSFLDEPRRLVSIEQTQRVGRILNGLWQSLT